jgi:lipopolysaccharide export system permease protein
LPWGGRAVSSAGLNTFDRHLLREWFRIMGIVLLATVGLMFVQVLFDDFQRLRDLGARGVDLWIYVLVTLPSFLAYVLPLTLLLSLLFALGQLHRANELTAMRAAGVGFLRMTRPVWLVGLFACGAMGWLNSSIVPWSVERSRQLNDQIQDRHDQKIQPAERVGAVGSVGFDNYERRRLWFFNSYSRGAGRGYGVTVTLFDANRRELSRIRATEARPLPGAGGWEFLDGNVVSFDPGSGVVDSVTPFERLVRAEFREDPALMLLIDRRPVDLSFFELRTLMDYFEVGKNPKAAAYAVRYYGLLADTLSPLIIIAIAIPFAVSGVRVNPAVGVSKSIGLFFVYYMLNNLAGSLALKGVMEPEVAAWLPNAVLGLLAVWFFARLR